MANGIEQILSKINDLNINIHLKIKSEDNIDKTLIIYFEGIIDNSNSTYLSETLEEIVVTLQEYNKICMELSGLRYVSSTGVGALANSLNKAMELNKKLYMCNFTNDVKTIFEMMGILNFFNVVNNFSEIENK